MKQRKIQIILITALTLIMAFCLTACIETVSAVTVNGPDAIALNETVQYSATVTPVGAKFKGEITWTIMGANTVGATISKNGELMATSEGEVTIAATAGDRVGAKTVTVGFVEATGITVEDVSGNVDTVILLSAVLSPDTASNTNITYELLGNNIGAVLTGNKVTSGVLGSVNYRARIGDLVSNTGIITFVINQSNGAIITTSEQLGALRNNLSGKYQLGADINLTGTTDWTPIGTDLAPFTGTLTGNGFEVKNLTIDNSSTNGLGLFGVIGESGAVKNLSVQADITGGIAGGIAGVNYGTINNCRVRGTIGKSDADFVGGIVGKQENGNLNNNTNNATVVGSDFVGGIAGEIIWDHYDARFSDCTNNGAVSGKTNVGGIVGKIGSGINTQIRNITLTAQVTSCVNNGEITASGDCAGGIAGGAYGVINDYDSQLVILFYSCENDNEVVGELYVGGILGEGFLTEINESINGEGVTGKAYVGGIAGFTDALTDCENNGVASAVGSINESGAKAYLGGIVGRCTDLTNCINTAEISYEGSGAYVGGIAGYISGSITGCKNEANITSKGTSVGGIAGYAAFGIAQKSIEDCINDGEITAAGSVGGIIGNVVAEINNLWVKAYITSPVSGCKNNGVITATAGAAGGIIGYAQGILDVSDSSYHKISFELCTNTADINGKTYVGGFVGYGEQTVFNNLINKKTITGQTYVGGIAGRGTAFNYCENEGEIKADGYVSDRGVNYAYVGGIAGYAVTVTACKNEADFTYSLNAAYVGGIAGYVFGGDVINSENRGAISSLGEMVGGIAGHLVFAGRNGKIENCINFGAISGASQVGGILGRVSATDSGLMQNAQSFIRGCKNNGAVLGTGLYVGGIAGAGDGASIRNELKFTNCENTGKVDGSSNDYTAGILGYRVFQVNMAATGCKNSGLINNGSGQNICLYFSVR